MEQAPRLRQRYYSCMYYEEFQERFSEQPMSILFRPKEDPDNPPPLDLGSTASDSSMSPKQPSFVEGVTKNKFTLTVSDWAEYQPQKRSRSHSQNIPSLIYQFLDRQLKFVQDLQSPKQCSLPY